MNGLIAVCTALVVCGLGAAGRHRLVVARPDADASLRHPPAHPRPARGGRFELQRRRDHRLDQTFPDLLDLFVVTVQAGLLPVQAVADLRAIVDSVLVPGLDEVVARIDRGERFADALSALVEAWGPRALMFVATVTATERSGLALAPALERLADEARQHRRRGAEASARELPVRLSFPLVLCTLPAFVLVAIVPLLVGALSSLRSA